MVFETRDIEKKYNLVIKISKADNGFFSEVLALLKLSKIGITPNVPKLYSWFISDELPPKDEAGWSRVHQVVANSTQFQKHLIPEKLYGYIIMENGEGGTLSSFFQYYLSKVPSIPHAWYTLDITIFQLIYSVAALPQCGILHRDLGGSNNILVAKISKGSSSEDSDWWFSVGDINFCFPRPTFKPIMIDFGTAKHLIAKQSLKTYFRFTTLRYRAPELIFVSTSPNGRLQPWYTTTSDLFSIGMTILELVFGNFCNSANGVTSHDIIYQNHPFMKYKCPKKLPIKIEELHKKLVKKENDEKLSEDKRKWAKMLRKGFIDKNESKLLGRYLWGMYNELGIPNNEIWPGIESTHIWIIMNDIIESKREKNKFIPPSQPRLFDNPILKEYLSEKQLSLLKDILQYNPKSRPDVIKVLKSDVFDHLRAKYSPSKKIKYSISAKNACSWPSHS